MIPIDRRTLFGWLGLAAAPIPMARVAAASPTAEAPLDMYGHVPAYAEPIGYAEADRETHFDPLDHL